MSTPCRFTYLVVRSAFTNSVGLPRTFVAKRAHIIDAHDQRSRRRALVPLKGSSLGTAPTPALLPRTASIVGRPGTRGSVLQGHKSKSTLARQALLKAAADARPKIVGGVFAVRLVAIRTIIAAIGARMTIDSDPTTPRPLVLFSRSPPRLRTTAIAWPSEQIVTSSFPRFALTRAFAPPFVPPTPRLAIEAHWRAHPIRADRLARALAGRSQAPAGWTWRLGDCRSGLPSTSPTLPAPFREHTHTLGSGFCCVSDRSTDSAGTLIFGLPSQQEAVWHSTLVWSRGGSGTRRAAKSNCCGASKVGDVRRNAEVDHCVPLFRVWREYRDTAWPGSEFWGLPNLQLDSRNIHVAKCAVEGSRPAKRSPSCIGTSQTAGRVSSGACLTLSSSSGRSVLGLEVWQRQPRLCPEATSNGRSSDAAVLALAWPGPSSWPFGDGSIHLGTLALYPHSLVGDVCGIRFESGWM